MPDLVKIAIDKGVLVGTIKVDPFEALGINTVEELRLIEKMWVEVVRKQLEDGVSGGEHRK